MMQNLHIVESSFLVAGANCSLLDSAKLEKPWGRQMENKQAIHQDTLLQPSLGRLGKTHSFIHSLPTKFNPRFTGPAWQIHCLPGYLPQPPPPHNWPNSSVLYLSGFSICHKSKLEVRKTSRFIFDPARFFPAWSTHDSRCNSCI